MLLGSGQIAPPTLCSKCVATAQVVVQVLRRQCDLTERSGSAAIMLE